MTGATSVERTAHTSWAHYAVVQDHPYDIIHNWC